MGRVRGGTKSEFVDNRQIVGKIETGKFERTDVPGYPLDALREALASALCHRDYTEGGGAVDLAIYDDRIEIVSSGPLHFGLTVENLFSEHQSRPWNPVVADVLYKRGVIESWGRGSLKMVEFTRQVGLVSPEFETSPHSFTVRFRSQEYMPPTRVSHDLTPLHRQILACLQTLGPRSSCKVVAALDGTAEPWRVLRQLQSMGEFGLVTMSGQRRSAKWFLTHESESISF